MNEVHYLLGHMCNLTCDFCIWDKKYPETSLKFKKKIIDNIAGTGIKNITISGGEPLLSKDSISIIRYAKSKNLSVVLHTNGLLLTNKIIKQLAPIVTRISLTIDGSSPETSYRMRKSRSMASKVIKLINLLNKYNINVSVKTLITKINKKEIVNIGQQLEETRIKYWTLLEFNPINKGAINKDKFTIKRSEFNKIAQIAKSSVTKFPVKINFVSSNNDYCFVAANGEVYSYKKQTGDKLIGDIKKEPLSKIIINIH